MIYRSDCDRTRLDCDYLLNLMAGTDPSACWIVGAGASLRNLDPLVLQRINQSPAAKFAVNLAGRGKDGQGYLVKPTHWTAFDSTAKFHPSVFLDPTIQKFVRAGREMDLLYGRSEKVCDCPNTFFINSENKKYGSFFGEGPINHSLDSFIQALDIAIRLGFRKLYLIGTEMKVTPSDEQIAFARSKGVIWEEGLTTVFEKDDSGRKINTRKTDLFGDFVRMTERHMTGDFQNPPSKESFASRQAARKELENVGREAQYAFSETKSLTATLSSDQHYWDRVQYLRLARKSISLLGVQITSCTPSSRLNAYYPYQSVESVLGHLEALYGRPEEEATVGMYSKVTPPSSLPYHRDIPAFVSDPGQEETEEPRKKKEPKKGPPVTMRTKPSKGVTGRGKEIPATVEVPVEVMERLKDKLKELEGKPVNIEEVG